MMNIIKISTLINYMSNNNLNGVNISNLLYIIPVYLLSTSSMSQFITFFSGTVFGAYLAQNYQIPDVKSKIDELKVQLQSIEEKHKKDLNNNSDSENNK